MTNPLQGSTITFSGFLKDDNGVIITDFTGLTFRALIKSKLRTESYLFSSAASGDTAISISTASGSTGLVSWKVIPTQSKNLSGETVLEIEVKETASGDRKMGKTIVFCVEETNFAQHINF